MEAEPSPVLIPPAPHRRAAVLACGVLVLLHLLVRLPNVRAMPAFVDEGIYVRWAQMIADDPLKNLWVSMVDAKLPLHYWLLAGFYKLGGDPLTSARIASVVFGAATIPLVWALWEELRRLAAWRSERVAGGVWPPVVAALFLIFSPLVGFFQRMGLAEALVLMEGVAVAWAALRYARQAAGESPRRGLWRAGVLLGALWGAMLITKQNFSYLHAALPPLALGPYGRRGAWGRLVRRAWGPLLAGAGLALAIFVPMLFTRGDYPLWVRLVYKSHFYDRAETPGSILGGNLRWLFVPGWPGEILLWPHDAGAPLRDGALWTYLTPPVLLLLLTALVLAAVRRRGTAALFLGGWSLVLLLPLAMNPYLQVVRYSFLGLVPLILLAAWAAAEIGEWLAARTTYRAAVRAAFTAACLGWAAPVTLWQLADPRAATLLARDRLEYLYDSSSLGFAQQAADFFAAEARRGPIVVITWPRLADDYVWTMLKRNVNVRLYCTDEPALPMQPPPADTRLVLGTETWFADRKAEVTLPAGMPVYRSILLLGERVSQPPQELQQFGPYTRCVKIVLNDPPVPGTRPMAGLALLRIDAPTVPPP
jgi:hypothetical protein